MNDPILVASVTFTATAVFGTTNLVITGATQRVRLYGVQCSIDQPGPLSPSWGAYLCLSVNAPGAITAGFWHTSLEEGGKTTDGFMLPDPGTLIGAAFGDDLVLGRVAIGVMNVTGIVDIFYKLDTSA